ncbi:hypothetical protein BIU88_05015 [Chlorobaculum limnaeum]|uniref:Uncharacterized protein n=1 Tax=Chlorobaculum limnaeum TaxID=274537 RepID=A0A1D8CXB1_CHLLM|nr:hypothetical protein [Chlorobaculum limnaeum]AOS83560.1 hypothetical protein BIU88_05015 [Chlorobaculum limnaeum]
MNRTEAQTRSGLVDRLLAQSGWNIKDPMQVVEEFDILMSLPDGVEEARTPFLVDRIALRDQAQDAFKEHLPNESRWLK